MVRLAAALISSASIGIARDETEVKAHSCSAASLRRTPHFKASILEYICAPHCAQTNIRVIDYGHHRTGTNTQPLPAIHTKQSLSLGLCAPTDVKTILDHIVNKMSTCVLRIAVRALRTVHCVCDPCAALCVPSTTLANAGSATMLLQHDVGIPGNGHRICTSALAKP